jgi:hypothetical protein
MYLCITFFKAMLQALFVPTSQLAFPAEKLRSQKQEQTANFSTGF